MPSPALLSRRISFLRSVLLNWWVMSAIKQTGNSSPFDAWILRTLTAFAESPSFCDDASRFVLLAISLSVYEIKSESVL